MRCSSLHRFQGRGDRQVKRHWPTDEAPEPKMLVEGHGSLVFRIDDQCENGRISTGSATRGIDQERTAKPPATKPLIDGKTSDETRRQNPIARQAFGFFWRKIGERKAGSSECVIGGDHPCPVARDKAIADPPPDILRCQIVQITIEHCHAARKILAIVSRAERFKRELTRHYGSRIRRLCASAARINAAEGAGGLRIASAKAR